MIKHVVTASNIMFMHNEKPYSFANSHPDYSDIYKHVMNNEIEDLDVLLSKHTFTLSFLKGKLYTLGGILYINSGDEARSVDPRMHTRLYQLVKQHKDTDEDCRPDIRSLILFINNLYANPSADSIDDLFRFLGHNSLPLTDDGCFIAYKLVRDNYMDIHSGTFNNSVGQVPTMRREDVQFNREVTCSRGLHFCSRGYLPHYGNMDSRIMILKVNPADVVSIPTDYNNAKGRACKYEVIGEIPSGVKREAAIDEVESKGITVIGNLLTKLKSFFTGE